MVKSKSIAVDLSEQFALEILDFYEVLLKKRKFDMARQILRSGTSIGANIREAQGAESRSDFIHKLKIASKEAEETQYWLSLCMKSKHYPTPEANMMEHILSLQKIISKIISTSKKNTK